MTEKKKAGTKASTKPAEPETIDLHFPMANIVLRERNVRSGEIPNLEELKASVAAEGVIQPVVLEWQHDAEGKKTGKAELVAGYRRYFASKKLTLKTIPARFVSADESRKHRIAMIENIQREDMNPMDIAVGIQQMQENEGLDQKDVAKSLGVSEGYVSQHLGLLKLPSKAQGAVRSGKLEMTHARALGRLKDEETIISLLKEASSMTATDLNTKVEFLVQKEKEKIAKEKEKEKEKENGKGGRKPSKGGTPEPAPERKSLAERYAEAELEPLNKTSLREKMVEVATKLDRAESESKRAEYKYTLKGLEIAAGIKD